MFVEYQEYISMHGKGAMASHEIKCPHCGESFTIDEAGYADIVQQVRGQESTANSNHA